MGLALILIGLSQPLFYIFILKLKTRSPDDNMDGNEVPLRNLLFYRTANLRELFLLLFPLGIHLP